MDPVTFMQQANQSYQGFLGISILLTIFLVFTISMRDHSRGLVITTVSSMMLSAIGIVPQAVTIGLILVLAADLVLGRRK